MYIDYSQYVDSTGILNLMPYHDVLTVNLKKNNNEYECIAYDDSLFMSEIRRPRHLSLSAEKIINGTKKYFKKSNRHKNYIDTPPSTPSSTKIAPLLDIIS